jgi:hypothetical protein
MPEACDRQRKAEHDSAAQTNDKDRALPPGGAGLSPHGFAAVAAYEANVASSGPFRRWALACLNAFAKVGETALLIAIPTRSLNGWRANARQRCFLYGILISASR